MQLWMRGPVAETALPFAAGHGLSCTAVQEQQKSTPVQTIPSRLKSSYSQRSRDHPPPTPECEKPRKVCEKISFPLSRPLPMHRRGKFPGQRCQWAPLAINSAAAPRQLSALSANRPISYYASRTSTCIARLAHRSDRYANSIFSYTFS